MPHPTDRPGRARSMTPLEREAAVTRDAGQCAACQFDPVDDPEPLEAHHRLPRSRARNLHDWHNLVMLCGKHHRAAHETSGWPWLIAGAMVRGVFVGQDPIYRVVYNGAPWPSVEDLAEVLYPDEPVDLIAWHVHRARDFLDERAGL
jgi:hypothetical protein